MYILLERNTVKEIIPDIDPVFPGVPIGDRYPAEFVEKLLHFSDDAEVEQNWIYDPESGTFFAPPAEEPDPQPPEPAPAPDTPTEAQRLGQQITDEQLARIAMGQQYTELELAILGGTSHV